MPNRLTGEHSPYLLQHADNPVDWYPWSDEPFDRAQSEDKPVFLSIGYAACHWCHVMERESFSDPAIAQQLNDGFISIKVDREERPDIDHIYMTACQLLTGQGGWPLSVFLTPDRRPFYAGTYFPPRARWGRPGFSELLHAIDRAWKTERKGLFEASSRIADAIRAETPTAEGELDRGIFDSTVVHLKRRFDAEYGGFGHQPKFPMPSHLLFLLRRHARGNALAKPMLERTLASMYRGGIFDHVGFGFARYSTDRKWLVPHFEKMLYDNAQLTLVYTEAHQAFGRGLCGRVARKTLEYLDRELSHPDGGFCSAQDADTEGVEGATYVWTPAEIRDVAPAGQRWCDLYGVTEDGNFEGKNIPNLLGDEIDDERVLDGLVPDPEDRELEDVRRKLLEVRKRRPQPLLDDKILTGWNGLAIAAMARAARVFGDERYLKRARQAYEFIVHGMLIDGRLQARYRNVAGIPGFLPDYSFFVWGCLELYDSSHQPEYLRRALELTDDMLRLFSGDGTGLYLTGRDAEQVLGRVVDLDDGAIPSGNSVALHNLLRLWQITGDDRWRDAADRIIRTVGAVATQRPAGFTFALAAAELAYFPTTEVVVSGDGQAGRDLIRVVRERYLPSVSLVVRDGNAGELEKIVPALADIPDSDEAAAYVCSAGACGQPIRDAKELARRLDGKKV